jgi:hypothetical protein
MKYKTTLGVLAATVAVMTGACVAPSTVSTADVYGPFPVTLKAYKGSKTNTVSYSGQIARHVLSDSIKKVMSKQNGGGYAEDTMLAYFNGIPGTDLLIKSHTSTKQGFKIKQKTVGAISKGKNLAGKFYKGPVPGWPGNMNGKYVALHMIKHAAQHKNSFDADNCYDYAQLLSKFTMGAISYNQAVDNYLDEKLLVKNKKPNDKPYKKGAHYTGKEHIWDEAFGYFGAAAHSLTLTPKQNYGVTKKKDFKSADFNKDGIIDLKSEMVFGSAYYAASSDKSGKTSYMKNITESFLEGRKIIAGMDGKTLDDATRTRLANLAAVIQSNWEKVFAEAIFKYAGSVYKDINAIHAAKNAGKDTKKLYRKYCKHWGELKGFSLAIQTGKSNLGETATSMNKLIGFGPVTMDATYVTGVNASGDFERKRRYMWSDYQVHMLKVQDLMIKKFGVTARANDGTDKMAALLKKLGESTTGETD